MIANKMVIDIYMFVPWMMTVYLNKLIAQVLSQNIKTVLVQLFMHIPKLLSTTV